MLYGIAVFPTDYAADPATIARLVEERGFESLHFPEHTHIPASRRTPYPAGGDLPPDSMAYALATTHGELLAGMSDGRILRSADRGESWEGTGLRVGSVTAMAAAG